MKIFEEKLRWRGVCLPTVFRITLNKWEYGSSTYWWSCLRPNLREGFKESAPVLLKFRCILYIFLISYLYIITSRICTRKSKRFEHGFVLLPLDISAIRIPLPYQHHFEHCLLIDFRNFSNVRDRYICHQYNDCIRCMKTKTEDETGNKNNYFCNFECKRKSLIRSSHFINVKIDCYAKTNVKIYKHEHYRR